MSQFGELYSRYYDLLYKDKDYLKEAQYILDILPDQKTESLYILDVGCGTGKHAEFLAGHGHKVHGVDLSSEMLELAHKRQEKSAESLSFSQGNIQSLDLDNKYDVIVSLFHVLSYQNEHDDILRSLLSVKKHLKKGGVFIFDFWYGPGVLTDLPAERVKEINGNGLSIIRNATPEMEPMRNLVKVNYDIYIEDTNTGEKVKKTEQHIMRYFFDPELELYCSLAGLKVVKKLEWMKDSKPNFDSWNVVWVLEN